jgi:hypothetical protein
MNNVAIWTAHDERGTNTVGLALIVLLLLLVLSAATQFGSAFVDVGGHRVGDAANVAARQRQGLQRGFRVQQQTQLDIGAQSSQGPTSQQVRSSLAALPARWNSQLRTFFFEILPEDFRNLVEIFGKRAHQLAE